MTAPLIRSATKRQFLIQLGLDPNDDRTSQTYWLLKDEAIRAYEAQLQGRRDLLRPEYANQDPPYAAAHFTAAAFSHVVRLIYSTATPATRAYYNRGRTTQGDNWVISWMLYHVCRYRDGRNIRARSREFHADDDLDDSTGSGSSSTSSMTHTAGTFYDAARNYIAVPFAMSQAILRPSTARAAFRAVSRTKSLSTSFVRNKATLPDLPYDYAALEPAISGQIMELHHSKHHNTYVNSFNTAAEKLATAQQLNTPEAIADQIALQPVLNFHGGGHINHSLFWENLAPKGKGGGEPPGGELGKAIDSTFGGLENLKKAMNAKLAGIQGSGWAWLVKDNETGGIGIKTYANQDPVVGQFKPLLGIDAWEHAYYLQYQNRKAEYFSAVWDVVNWRVAEKRFG
ncbi:MAG: hypothetical protein L6R36_003499 [Xanthoria steineri]|nr:MAG: hypothetical protein L6R36_003499 [Xanthoria steineri]